MYVPEALDERMHEVSGDNAGYNIMVGNNLQQMITFEQKLIRRLIEEVHTPDQNGFKKDLATLHEFFGNNKPNVVLTTLTSTPGIVAAVNEQLIRKLLGQYGVYCIKSERDNHELLDVLARHGDRLHQAEKNWDPLKRTFDDVKSLEVAHKERELFRRPSNRSKKW